ncbi:MAG: amidohydrolase family protein [Paracoccaceae bacterium]|nr:MAG: amidohydrolase family protein [Paracoccaceae bacterium]
MRPDLVIRDAVIVTPAGRVRGDLAVAGGRIAAIGPDLPQGRREIAAEGRMLMPGGIDSHCHLAQASVAGEAPCPDDWATATRAAAAGGTTTVIPQSMAARGDDIAARLADYLAPASRAALIDHAVIVQMPDASPGSLAALPGQAARGFRAVKMFSTYQGYALADDELLSILSATAALGMVAILHAEDDALVRHATAAELAAGRRGLDRHTHARPQMAEAEMIHRGANYAAVTGARLHVYHVSGALALAEVARARARGVAITAETCAHYLSFTDADLARPGFEGAKFLCAPPLRGADDRATLWAALADGGLQIVSSDHSPSHRMPAIARALAGADMPFTGFGGGIPGLQTMLPAVFSGGVVPGRLTPERFAEVTSAAPARLFGLRGKGALAIGYDADLTLWDADAIWTVRHADMHSRVDFTPWDGVDLQGRPVLTVSRGRIVMQDGAIDDTSPGHGRLLAQEAPAT